MKIQSIHNAHIVSPGLEIESGSISIGDGKIREIHDSPAAAEGESRNFTGKLDWVEPFATQKPQNLNLEVRLWKHGEQPAIFFGVSPQPANHKIWAELRRIRDAFRFEE